MTGSNTTPNGEDQGKAAAENSLTRQLNLTFAFLDAAQQGSAPLDRTWLTTNVAGYSEEITSDGARKRLIRDLQALKRAGVPIKETTTEAGESAYVLEADQYELGELSFNAEEAAVLGLVGDLGGTSELGAFARSGWTKIAASGVTRDLAQNMHSYFAPTNDMRWLSTITLSRILLAKGSNSRLSFEYRASSISPAQTRTMDPWGLVNYRDRIYLVGFDIDRSQIRSFRITRINNVDITGPAEHRVPPEYVNGAKLQELVVDSLHAHQELIDATVSLIPGKANQLRPDLRPDEISAGREIYYLKDVDRAWLVHTAASYAAGGEAIVISPGFVREEVIALLRTQLDHCERQVKE